MIDPIAFTGLKIEDDKLIGIMASQIFAMNPNMQISSAVRYSLAILEEIKLQKDEIERQNKIREKNKRKNK
jgi:hypothetical protein